MRNSKVVIVTVLILLLLLGCKSRKGEKLEISLITAQSVKKTKSVDKSVHFSKSVNENITTIVSNNFIENVAPQDLCSVVISGKIISVESSYPIENV